MYRRLEVNGLKVNSILTRSKSRRLARNRAFFPTHSKPPPQAAEIAAILFDSRSTTTMMPAGVVDLIAKRTRPLHNVLVCEDHATIRECLVRDLAHILPENCEIVSASTGEEAID